MSKNLDKFKLCYVSGNWAYFTTQDITKQWGDDWNNIPYEHNAGFPYEYRPDIYSNDPNIEPWEIKKVVWEGPFNEPCEGVLNSKYSVEMINRGDVAWLRPCSWLSGDKAKAIFAGTPLPVFIDIVRNAGGNVYLPVAN